MPNSFKRKVKTAKITYFKKQLRKIVYPKKIFELILYIKRKILESICTLLYVIKLRNLSRQFDKNKLSKQF